MMLKRLMAAAVLAAFAAGVAVAADEPQVLRQQMMKKIGGSMGAMGAIAKGEKPFDADVVKAALTTIEENAKAFPDQFPAGTETGFETEASPKIWENMDDFKAEAAKLAEVAEAQLASMPADQAGVGATLKAVGAVCGECHQSYRMKK